jgi:hypothetical protein
VLGVPNLGKFSIRLENSTSLMSKTTEICDGQLQITSAWSAQNKVTAARSGHNCQAIISIHLDATCPHQDL